MTFFRAHLLRVFIPLVLAVLGAAACALLVPTETEAVRQQLLGFPDSVAAAQQARPWILAGLCFLPSLASLFYSFGGTLDRYMLRSFGENFLLCLASLVIIWFLLDFSDKLSDFRESDHMFQTMGEFYLARSPAMLMQLLPYSLLLSLLYSLGKFSTNREIIAMIQSGRGVVRITLPLLVVGLFASVFCVGLNYQWAPTAETRASQILKESQGKMPMEATNVLYRNAKASRLWEIGAFPRSYEKGRPLLDVEVTTTHPDNTLESRLSAKQAAWSTTTHHWTFHNAIIETFDAGNAPKFSTEPGSLVIPDWAETPWQLIKPGLSASELSIPDLEGWIRGNTRHQGFEAPQPYLTQWQYRWALPLTCLVTVLLATPLAIHFSRRGAAGSVFLAVVLSALMLLSTSICLALGESGTLRPAVAAWLPNAFFTLLALYLFRRRIIGKPIYVILRRLLPSND
jgi:lipopolysaccharide export system permease protein